MEDTTKVRRMLGGRSPAQFAQLPKGRRDAVLRRYLVRNRDDSTYVDPKNENGFMLRQEYFTGRDDPGRQLAKEAREIYYAENAFTVDSDWLGDFIRDPLADGKTMTVASLVRRVTVRVNIHDHRGPHDPDNGVESWVARELRLLFEFSGAEKIKIILWGAGAENGSDLATQLKIKEIASVIKELIKRFGSALCVLRASGKGIAILNSYWGPPSDMAKQNLREGKASFREMMQIQIEEWTRSYVEETLQIEDESTQSQSSRELSRTLGP